MSQKHKLGQRSRSITVYFPLNLTELLPWTLWFIFDMLFVSRLVNTLPWSNIVKSSRITSVETS